MFKWFRKTKPVDPNDKATIPDNAKNMESKAEGEALSADSSSKSHSRDADDSYSSSYSSRPSSARSSKRSNSKSYSGSSSSVTDSLDSKSDSQSSSVSGSSYSSSSSEGENSRPTSKRATPIRPQDNTLPEQSLDSSTQALRQMVQAPVVSNVKPPSTKRVVADPRRLSKLSIIKEEESPEGIPPSAVDLRLHGNEIYIGGCWGSVDIKDAVQLNHRTRMSYPPPDLMIPLDEVSDIYDKKQDWTPYQKAQERYSIPSQPELMRPYLV